ncbi:regulatory protein UhpC [Raoultella ornithinolytica]|nr:regulatory protein UhpC [Raoultella ornithinolytica]
MPCFISRAKALTPRYRKFSPATSLTRSDIGLLATLFYITYGLSKFFSGIVSDRSNARYFMGLGLIATGVVNILFGFSTSLWAFALLWALNAFFQGWGSPVCARLLTAWYSRTERGGWWALWNTAHNVGGALIPMVVGAAALHYGWRTGMMIAGMLAILAGLFLCWRLRDRPQVVGLPAVGDWRHDELEIAQQQEGAGADAQEILTKYVLLNPYIWLLSLCYVLVYVVRAAINDWGNLYMSETLGVDLVTANSAVTMFELGGFIGALVAGWGSDKLFNGNRGPMNLIFAAGILLSVGGLWLMPFASYVMQAACFFTTGFFVFGPQMLIGMAAAECSHKEAAGAATGFVGTVCLSRGIAFRLAAGAGNGNLALERLFRGDCYCCRHFCAAAAAVFKRSGAKNRQRSVTCLSFLPRVGQN